MLTPGTKVTAHADIMYGSLNEPSTETYDDYVVSMRKRMTTAKEYRKGQWVYYFNPRKSVGRQDKWERKYTDPFLIVGTPSPVTVQLQQRKGAKTTTVHIDKVKQFLREVPELARWRAELRRQRAP